MKVPTSEKIYLKMLDGFDFENLCAKIIEKLGWGRVTVTPKVNDGGKDLIIEGPNSKIIYVECKHMPDSKIGRPVIQKFHSAIMTSKASEGIVITTGSFTKDAIEHVKNLNLPIKLIDLLTLSEMAQSIGIILIAGENVVDISYTAYASDSLLEKIQYSRLRNVKTNPRKIEELIKFETIQKGFLPIYFITYSIHEKFSTTVGELDSIDEDNQPLSINGLTRKLAERSVLKFMWNNSSGVSSIPNIKETAHTIETISKSIDLVSLNELARKFIVDKYAKEISYVGQNNVYYKKQFYPKQSSISLKDLKVIEIRYRKIRINQGNYVKEMISLDSESDILLDHDFPFCDFCRSKKNLMVCDSCASIFDYGFRKHGKKCSLCSKTICVNCLYKYKWPSFLRGYICEECSLKLYGKDLSEKRKRRKIFKPDAWELFKYDKIFEI